MTLAPEHLETARDLAGALKLERPLAFIDLETTGTSVSTDRVVEVAVLKLFPDGTVDLRSQRVNPGIPISPEATAVHGITDADVSERPNFRRIAASLLSFLDDCDIAGFGVARFDLRVLEAEFARAELEFSIRERAVVDALAIFFDREPRGLRAAMQFYCGRDLDNAHNAEGDVLGSLEVLAAQLERYPDLPTEIGGLDLLSAPVRPDPSWLDPDGVLMWHSDSACLNVGKHKGVPLASVLATDPGYIDWMLGSTFSDQVKEILSDARAGKFSSKQR